LCNFGPVYVVRAQNRTGATTHPDEGLSSSSLNNLTSSNSIDRIEDCVARS